MFIENRTFIELNDYFPLIESRHFFALDINFHRVLIETWLNVNEIVQVKKHYREKKKKKKKK